MGNKKKASKPKTQPGPAAKRFGEKLAQLMKDKGKTQKEFSELGPSRISRILRGQSPVPSLDVAERFTRVLGLSLEQFYKDPDTRAAELDHPQVFEVLMSIIGRGTKVDIADAERALRHILRDIEDRESARRHKSETENLRPKERKKSLADPDKSKAG